MDRRYNTTPNQIMKFRQSAFLSKPLERGVSLRLRNKICPWRNLFREASPLFNKLRNTFYGVFSSWWKNIHDNPKFCINDLLASCKGFCIKYVNF